MSEHMAHSLHFVNNITYALDIYDLFARLILLDLKNFRDFEKSHQIFFKIGRSFIFEDAF